jgi:glutathione S-transferase
LITLWELGGQDGRRYSLFSWRARMALRHKGLEFESCAVCMSDKKAIEFSGGKTVPVIRDGDHGEMRVIRDSWKIAEYLEKAYPDHSLFGGAAGLTQTFNVWVDRVIVPAMLPVVVADIHERVDPSDRAYFRAMMEKIVKKPLEQAAAERAQALERLSRAIEPMQSALKRQPYVSGEAPAYADYILFSVFQWARIMSPGEVLQPESALFAWRERVLDLFAGFARTVKIA